MMKSLFIIPISFTIFCSGQNLTNQALVNNMNFNLQMPQKNLSHGNPTIYLSNLNNAKGSVRTASESRSILSINNYKTNKKVKSNNSNKLQETSESNITNVQVNSSNNLNQHKSSTNNQVINHEINLLNTNQSKVTNTDNSIQTFNDQEVKTSNSKITNLKQSSSVNTKSIRKNIIKNNHYKSKNTYKQNFWYNLKKSFSKAFGKKKKIRSSTRCAKW